MEQFGSNARADRGNWPEATQDKTPQWLASKQQYFAFGTLRAYPKQQLRKMCAYLHEGSLPLDQPSVHTLLKQTLFHIGDVDVPLAISNPWTILSIVVVFRS